MAIPIELVIFDNDGVLVDSEHLTHGVLVEMLAELGVQMALEEALALFRGGKMSDCLAEIGARLGEPVGNDFEPSFRSRCKARYEAELTPIEGVTAVVEALAQPFCVASNGPADKIHVTLRAAGLMPHFEGRVFSAYTRAIFKPEPDLFLQAAAHFGIEPSRCVVIEDSTFGVRAARAAGMRCVGYAPEGDGRELSALGAEVVSHMSHVLPLLARLG